MNPEVETKTFGEKAFDLLSGRLGRAPSAAELIEYLQSEVVPQDHIEAEVMVISP